MFQSASGPEFAARDQNLIDQVYHRLRERYGSQRERPGTAFDALLQILLSPNAQRENVDRAIGNLREAGLLDPRALAEAPADELAVLIEPAGNARRKAARLRSLLRYAVERHDGSLATMFATGVETLRTELLAINGLGRETADAILLIAGKAPIFVADLHAHRVFKRHGWTEFDADGETLRQQVESGLEPDAAVLGEFHALIARVGREHCRKTPQCEGCPLAELLPEGGPLEPAF
jgi:endonuclease-3 related protein